MKCACKEYMVRDTMQVLLKGTGTHSAAVCAWRDAEGTFLTAARTALAVEALRDKTTNY